MGVWAFLFTDLEGSTRRWENTTEAMRVALERHHELLRREIADHGGRVLSDMGDGIAAVFSSPRGAFAASVAAQRSLTAERWLDVDPLRARMALHVGEAFEHGDELRGPTLNRCARVMAAAHGGQLVCTTAMAELVADSLPHDVELRDLGEHRLRDLARPEHVFEVVASGLQAEFPPLRTLESFRTNLPWQLSSFVGREVELAEIGALLDEHRLVTLVGPGGLGKTRLAVQVAADRLDRFRDGAWLIDLTALSDPRGLIAFVAATLSVSTDAGRGVELALLDALRRQQILIVLDNCEHVLEAASAFVVMAQSGAPDVRLLATSREALAIPGEHVVSPRPLTAPDVGVHDQAVAASQPAFELFVDRARESRADFAIPDRAAVEAIGDVCRSLDGMPLAIELAAARVSSMTPREIAANLDARFRLLTGRRAGADRHRTLRAVIDWSYDLLDPPHREVLDSLSVFAGPFRVDAVAAVAGCDEIEALDVLGVLVDKSVVVADPVGDTTEYRLLETIRQYGSERLADAGLADVVRDRHLDFYLDFARQVDDAIGFSGDEPLRTRLDRELTNIRPAVAWAAETGRVDIAVLLVSRLCWLEASPLAKNEVSALAVEVSGIGNFELEPGAATVLRQAVDELWSRGDMPAMDRLGALIDRAASTTPRDRLRIALARRRTRYAIHWWADEETARQIVAAAAEIDDDRLIASAHTSAAINAVLLDDRDEARTHGEIAVAASRRAGSSSGARLAYALLALGLALDTQEHHDEAFVAFEEALAVTYVGEIWTATEALAGHYIRRGQITEAAALYGGLLDHHRSLGHLGRASELCGKVAELLATIGRDSEAIQARTVLADQQPPLFDVATPFFAASLDRARQRLTLEELAAATATGSVMTFDELVDLQIEQLTELSEHPSSPPHVR